MLVLTRKAGEVITIGDNIQVRVLAIKGGQVRIGIEAPRQVSVNREEVLRSRDNSTGMQLSAVGDEEL